MDLDKTTPQLAKDKMKVEKPIVLTNMIQDQGKLDDLSSNPNIFVVQHGEMQSTDILQLISHKKCESHSKTAIKQTDNVEVEEMAMESNEAKDAPKQIN